MQVQGQYGISDNLKEFHKFQQGAAIDAVLLPIFVEYLHSTDTGRERKKREGYEELSTGACKTEQTQEKHTN